MMRLRRAFAFIEQNIPFSQTEQNTAYIPGGRPCNCVHIGASLSFKNDRACPNIMSNSAFEIAASSEVTGRTIRWGKITFDVPRLITLELSKIS